MTERSVFPRSTGPVAIVRLSLLIKRRDPSVKQSPRRSLFPESTEKERFDIVSCSEKDGESNGRGGGRIHSRKASPHAFVAVVRRRKTNQNSPLLDPLAPALQRLLDRVVLLCGPFDVMVGVGRGARHAALESSGGCGPGICSSSRPLNFPKQSLT